ncbi:hypothetical protein ACLB1T_16125 [Escherichia coli]
MIDNEVKIFAKEKEKMLCNKLSFYREHAQSSEDTRKRNEFERDYARIISLRSAGYRGKCSSLKVDPQKFNRNRLTHSLEVARDSPKHRIRTRT